jgi:hypothetical protein
VADIDGTDTERRFFHRFRMATEAGVSLHVSNASSFWTKLAPRLSHHDKAIKHALVALGAAWQLYKTSPTTKAGLSDRRHPLLLDTSHLQSTESEHLERFIIVQYNKAIASLQENVNFTSPDGIEVTLICCLLFICLENLRFNHKGVVAHLQNGLHIIGSSLSLESLWGPFNRPESVKSAKMPPNSLVTVEELRDLVKHFHRSEICAAIFSTNVSPVISTRLYKYSRLDDGSASLSKDFNRLVEGHAAMCKYTSDVFARAWEMRGYKGNTTFWSDRTVQQEQQALRARGSKALEKYRAFMSSSQGPKPGSMEYSSGNLDMIHIISCRAIAERMPYRTNDQISLKLIDDFQESSCQEIVVLARRIQEDHKKAGRYSRQFPDFTIDLGLVAPMYFVWAYSSNPFTRNGAMNILEELYQREGLWDARSLLKVMQATCRENEADRMLAAVVPDPVGGAGSIPNLYETYTRCGRS